MTPEELSDILPHALRYSSNAAARKATFEEYFWVNWAVIEQADEYKTNLIPCPIIGLSDDNHKLYISDYLKKEDKFFKPYMKGHKIDIQNIGFLFAVQISNIHFTQLLAYHPSKQTT